MPDPSTLADVRTHIERRLAELSNVTIAQGSSQLEAMLGSARRIELIEVLLLLDQAQQGGAR